MIFFRTSERSTSLKLQYNRNHNLCSAKGFVFEKVTRTSNEQLQNEKENHLLYERFSPPPLIIFISPLFSLIFLWTGSHDSDSVREATSP